MERAVAFLLWMLVALGSLVGFLINLLLVAAMIGVIWLAVAGFTGSPPFG